MSERSFNDANRIISDWLLVLFLTSATAAYQTPAMRRLVMSQIKGAQQDPLLTALLGCVMLALARFIVHVPRLITATGDDSISLQTALGTDLNVSSTYWQSREIFHGFLEWHFRDLPGRGFVVIKNYRILIGGTGGLVIDDQRWSDVVSKKMKLTMAILLDEVYTCPKCNMDLQAGGFLEALC